MTNLSDLNAGKLRKAMSKVYDFGDKGIMSLENFFKLYPPLRKQIYIQEYSNRRINLEYKKFDKPHIRYMVYGCDKFCVEVPKMYYNSLDISEVR